jgi:hypothetical protein
MRVSEEPVCIYLFREKPIFLSSFIWDHLFLSYRLCSVACWRSGLKLLITQITKVDPYHLSILCVGSMGGAAENGRGSWEWMVRISWARRGEADRPTNPTQRPLWLTRDIMKDLRSYCIRVHGMSLTKLPLVSDRKKTVKSITFFTVYAVYYECTRNEHENMYID